MMSLEDKAAVLCCGLALMVMLCVSPVSQAQINKLGPQIQLTTHGTFWPALEYNPHSDQYLALWIDVTDPNGWQLKARRIDATNGNLLGSEFHISTDPPNIKAGTRSATYNSVNHEWFVVCKGHVIEANEDDILAQRIASDGTRVGGILQLVAKDDFQSSPDCGHDPSRNRYLVAWVEKVSGTKQVFSQVFSVAGSPVSSQYRLSEVNDQNKHSPNVAYNTVTDEFMVIWKDYRHYPGEGQDNKYADIYGQRINASDGTKIGDNIPVYSPSGTPYQPDGQENPYGIVCNPNDGRYGIANTKLTAEEGYTTWGLIINSDGSHHSGVFHVSYPETGYARGLAFCPANNTYLMTFQDVSANISCRRFLASGVPLGVTETILDSGAFGGGDLAARGGTGEFLQIAHDGGHALKGQRFSFGADTTPPGPVNPLRAYQQSDTTVLLTWAAPGDVDVYHTMVRYRTDTFPADHTEGTLLSDQAASPNSSHSFTHTVTPGETYYYAAFAYDSIPNYSAGTNATPSDYWLNETFDNYSNGPLGGQGGWVKAIGKNSCTVQDATRVGTSGGAVELYGPEDVYDDSTVANFGTIDEGYHKLAFDMRRNATAVKNQAFMGLYHDDLIVTRVYWSTGFSMLTGPGTTFNGLVTTPLSGRWYHVEIGIDMDNHTLDAWVDGVQKVSGKPFYKAATQLNLINLTGYSLAQTASYIDNLTGSKGEADYLPGDLDNDGDIDLFDVLRLVDIILGRPPEPSAYEQIVGDLDEDGDLDLFDVLVAVDILLG